MNVLKSQFAGKKVLVTGGLGFIGSNLAIRLQDLQADVHILDLAERHYGANPYNIAPIKNQVTISYGDIRSKAVVTTAVAGCDYVFALAGQGSHPGSMKQPVQDLEINTLGHLNILEACRHLPIKPKIVLTSTRQVYGKQHYLPVDEKHPLQPPDVNAVNKLAAENLSLLYHDVYQLPVVILRLTNVYGPRMELSATDKGFICVFVKRALQGEPIDIFGTGEQRRDLNHVDDVVEALLLAAATPKTTGNVYNLGHYEAVTLNRIMDVLQEECRFPFKKIPFPEDRKKIDIGEYWGDYKAFASVTGWQPKVDITQGLKQTLDFFRENLHHYI